MNPVVADVAIANAPNYDAQTLTTAINAIMQPLSGLGAVASNAKILLKPNFIIARKDRLPVITDMRLILAFIDYLSDCGYTNIALGDSPGFGSIKGIVQNENAIDALKKRNVRIRDFSKTVTVANAFPFGPKRLSVAKDVVTADAVINMPKLKAHGQAYMTLSIKNMFGALPGKRKGLAHFFIGDRNEQKSFLDMILAYYANANPVFTLIDAITIIEGAGPTNGEAKPLGLLFGANDGVAIEAVIEAMAEQAKGKIATLETARRHSFGVTDCSRIAVHGDYDMQTLPKFSFKEAPPSPFAFTVSRMIRSAGKHLASLFGEKNNASSRSDI